MLKRHPLLFRYPGGKYYALHILYPFWANVDHDEYREPFVGGGSIFFNKAKSQFNLLNDIDHDLITTYKIISDPEQREELTALVSKEIASKERWREMYNFRPVNDLEVAYRYYYLNRTSFSGKLSSPAWGYRPKRSLPPERWFERIAPCGKKLEGVTLTDLDFESIIKSPTLGKKVLMYVDPPYFAPPKNKHYRNGFSLEDHLRLCKALQQSKCKFFLTYDDVPEVRELYNWAIIHEAKFYYRVDNSTIQKGKRKIGFELVISNYELSGQSLLLWESSLKGKTNAK